MKQLAFALLICCISLSNAQFENCQDPPNNNAISEIIVKALEALRPYFSTGFPDLGIPPLDPLGPLINIPFHIDAPGLKMDGNVNQTVVKNLAEFFICSVNISVGLSQKFEIEFRMENFHIDGMYDVVGTIAHLLPVYGNGKYELDTYNAGFVGGAKVSYNLLTDRAKIKDLKFNIFFETLKINLECILGCGDMADLINGVASDIGKSIWDAVMGFLSPSMADLIEEFINEVLKDIPISSLIPKPNKTESAVFGMGNGNLFMDVALGVASNSIVRLGLDPAPLPDVTFSLQHQSQTELFLGKLHGLSTIQRTGTATIDRVGDWVFLYANIGFEDLTTEYAGIVKSNDGTVKNIEISGNVPGVSVYVTARRDTYSDVFDLDQFVISEFGKMNIEIKGLGILGFLEEALIQSVANSLRVSISEILGGQIKQIIQDALNETPWDQFYIE